MVLEGVIRDSAHVGVVAMANSNNSLQSMLLGRGGMLRLYLQSMHPSASLVKSELECRTRLQVQ